MKLIERKYDLLIPCVSSVLNFTDGTSNFSKIKKLFLCFSSSYTIGYERYNIISYEPFDCNNVRDE